MGSTPRAEDQTSIETTRAQDEASQGDTPDPPVTPGVSEIARAAREHRDWAGLLMGQIARVLKDGGDWCDVVKAQTLAAMILALRPRLVCEIGVWMGGSMIPMLLALRAVAEVEGALHGTSVLRRGVAIDAWSAEASCAGQSGEDRAWWSRAPHERAKETFLARLRRHDLVDLCQVVHAHSDDVSAPDAIGLLHLDGNHAEQAVRDTERFAARVEVGGLLMFDDLDWSGGHVARARDVALELGFRALFPLGSGVVLQRVSMPVPARG